MNRFRNYLLTTFAVGVIAFSYVISAAYAQQDSTNAPQTAEQKAAAEKRDKVAATQARAMRDAAIKKRQAAKEYIKKVVEGQQPGAADTAGKEVTK